MSKNQKLSPLLAGRTIAAVEPPPATPAAPASPFAPSAATTWRVRFGDGSVLTVRTDGSAPTGADVATGRAVTEAGQKGTTLTLTCTAGTGTTAPGAALTGAAPAGAAVGALVFHTAEASACVMLRDAAGRMEYAD